MTKQEIVRMVLQEIKALGIRRFDLLGLTQIIRQDYRLAITDGSVSRYLRFENQEPESPVRNRCVSRSKSWYEFVS